MHGCLPFPAKLYHYLAFALTPLCDGQTVCGVRALIHNIGVQPIPLKTNCPTSRRRSVFVRLSEPQTP